MMSDSGNKRQKLDRKIDITDRVSPQLAGIDTKGRAIKLHKEEVESAKPSQNS